MLNVEAVDGVGHPVGDLITRARLVQGCRLSFIWSTRFLVTSSPNTPGDQVAIPSKVGKVALRKATSFMSSEATLLWQYRRLRVCTL